MTRKQLRKLKRLELLEMLLDQSKELKRIKEELEETKKLLEEKDYKIKTAGSIAEAAFSLNNIFEVAQRTADEYLENIRIIAEKETSFQNLAMSIVNETSNHPKDKLIKDENGNIVYRTKIYKTNTIEYYNYDIEVDDNDDYDIEIYEFYYDVA